MDRPLPPVAPRTDADRLRSHKLVHLDHPDSNVIAARPGLHCRHTLFNDKFTTRHVDGKVERRILNGVKDFGEVLSSCFGIMLSDSGALEAVAALAAERAASPDFFERSR